VVSPNLHLLSKFRFLSLRESVDRLFVNRFCQVNDLICQQISLWASGVVGSCGRRCWVVDVVAVGCLFGPRGLSVAPLLAFRWLWWVSSLLFGFGRVLVGFWSGLLSGLDVDLLQLVSLSQSSTHKNIK